MKIKGFGVIVAVLFLSFCVLGISIPAFASPDFQFTVPVKFKNMPDEVTVKIHVDLYDKNGNVIGGSMDLVIPMHMFQGNVDKEWSIDVFAKSGKNPYDAVKYKVSFTLTNSSKENLHPNTPGEDWTYAKPGTPVLDEIEGDIPMKALPVVISDNKK